MIGLVLKKKNNTPGLENKIFVKQENIYFQKLQRNFDNQRNIKENDMKRSYLLVVKGRTMISVMSHY